MRRDFSSNMKLLVTNILLVLAILSSGGSIIFPREPMLILIILMSLYGTKGNIKKALVPVFSLIILIMSIAAFQPRGLGQSFFIRLINFIAAFTMLNYLLHQGKSFVLSSLHKLLSFLPYQAIITFVLAKFVPFLFMNIEINGTNYKTIGFLFTYHEMLESDIAFPRPDGFFYEPGVFQFYLNLLLFLNLFVYKNYKFSSLIGLSIFTLQSSTGVLIMLIQILSLLLFSFEFSRYFKNRITKTALTLILIPPIFLLAQQNIEKKLTGESRGSFLARQYDLLSGVNAVYQNPIIGIGFDYKNYKSIAGSMTFEGIGIDELPVSAFDDRETNSNGFVFMLYSIGIPISLILIFGMFNSYYFQNRILFGILIVLSLFGEMLVFTPLFLVFIFSGIVSKKKLNFLITEQK